MSFVIILLRVIRDPSCLIHCRDSCTHQSRSHSFKNPWHEVVSYEDTRDSC